MLNSANQLKRFYSLSNFKKIICLNMDLPQFIVFVHLYCCLLVYNNCFKHPLQKKRYMLLVAFGFRCLTLANKKQMHTRVANLANAHQYLNSTYESGKYAAVDEKSILSPSAGAPNLWYAYHQWYANMLGKYAAVDEKSILSPNAGGYHHWCYAKVFQVVRE